MGIKIGPSHGSFDGIPVHADSEGRPLHSLRPAHLGVESLGNSRSAWAASRPSRLGNSSLNSELQHEYTQFHAHSVGMHPIKSERSVGDMSAVRTFLERLESGCFWTLRVGRAEVAKIEGDS